MRTEDVGEVGGGAGSIEQAEPEACVRRAVLVVEISTSYLQGRESGTRRRPVLGWVIVKRKKVIRRAVLSLCGRSG